MSEAQSAKRNHRTKSMLASYVRYSHLPGIFPRLRELAAKFGHFAYLLATIYGAVGLIPRAHPVLNPINIGKFGFRDVFGAASRNLVLSWKNIDQIAVFAAVILALITLVIQLGIIAFIAFTNTAYAAPLDFFATPNPEEDVVLIFLEQMFGDLNIFSDDGHSAPGMANTASHPVFQGLYEMLGFYSRVMMVFAVLIVLYFVLTVLAEAAQSGRPFGGRFNSVWAPIRLVVALGLLVPLGSHLNAGQYITLHIAKMGSGMASQAWEMFSSKILAHDATNRGAMLVQSNTKDMADLARSIFLAEVCMATRNEIEKAKVPSGYIELQYRIPDATPFATYSNLNAANNERKRVAPKAKHIEVAWVPKNISDAHKQMPRFQCGKLRYQFTESAEELSAIYSRIRESNAFSDEKTIKEYNEQLEATYVELQKRVDVLITKFRPLAVRIAKIQTMPFGKAHVEAHNALVEDAAFYRSMMDAVEEANNTGQEALTELYNKSNLLAREHVINYSRDKGWGTAANYYRGIGQVNQSYLKSTSDAQEIGFTSRGYAMAEDENTYPNLKNEVVLEKGTWWFDKTGETEPYRKVRERVRFVVRWADHNFTSKMKTEFAGKRNALDLAAIKSGQSTVSFIKNLVSEITSAINERDLNKLLSIVFSLEKLRELQANPTLDPMVGLQTIGYDLLSKASHMITVGIGVKFFAAATGALGDISGVKEISLAVASLLMVIAFIGFGIGFVLTFLLPLFPFMYFFFAVVAWILEIFEAVIAMPLWALGHLRIDGEGFAGGALTGYILLFSILLRPILIVFGLVGGYIAFGASAYFLQTQYVELVDFVKIGDLGGLASFIYMLLYGYLIYQLSTMCFKMVDNVPQQIIRWMGQQAQTFNDSRSEASDRAGATSFVVAGAGVAQQLSSIGGR